MSNMLLVAIGAIFILGIIYFFGRDRTIKKNIKHTSLQDASAQAFYNKKKNNEEKKFSIKERLELSWKFLYDITEIVLNKFSKDDREMVHQMGKTLAKTGMRYEHVVELGIRPMRSIGVAKEKEQSQGVGQ